jgi:hypothetical protein
MLRVNKVRSTGSFLEKKPARKCCVLTKEKLEKIRDSATAHNADDSLMALEGVFSDRIINHALWPEYSPDLTPCNFYLWSKLKDKVCRMNPP